MSDLDRLREGITKAKWIKISDIDDVLSKTYYSLKHLISEYLNLDT